MIKFRSSCLGKLMTNDRSGKAMGETAKGYIEQVFIENKYQRSKEYGSKYIDKGNQQEETAITLVSLITGKFFTKNEERIGNDFITGTPDLFIGESILKAKEGRDTKCSFDAFTFPFFETDLKKDYFYQNHGYMWLTGAEEWHTDFCLVNTPLEIITKEKERIYWQMDQPTPENSNYIDKLIELEKNSIFDIKDFKSDYPDYILTCQDWKFDIPKEERLKTFSVKRDEKIIQAIKERVIEANNYYNTL